MRTAFICLTIAFVAFVTASAWRENEQRKADAATRVADEIKAATEAFEAAQRQRLATQLPPTPPMQPESRSLTYMPQLGRYIEHDSRTSAMQSIGGGGGGGPAPKRTPDASEKIKSAWGFGKTALDEKR
jgi:hypothetical protein